MWWTVWAIQRSCQVQGSVIGIDYIAFTSPPILPININTIPRSKILYTFYNRYIIHLEKGQPSSMPIPRFTSSGCLEWTRAHDNLVRLSVLCSALPAWATSRSQPYQHRKWNIFFSIYIINNRKVDRQALDQENIADQSRYAGGICPSDNIVVHQH